MQYDFAVMDFPAFMVSFPQFSRVDRSVSKKLSENVTMIATETSFPGSVSRFEYVSDRSYIVFSVSSDRMHLKIHFIGELVFDKSIFDFSEVKSTVQKYS